MKKKKYTAGDIQILESIETVRKRPAMYIGSTGFWGFSNLLKMIIKNVFYKTNCNRFEIESVDKLNGKLIFNNLKTPINDSINEVLQNEAFEFAVLNALCSEYNFTLFDLSNNILTNLHYKKGILEKGIVENTDLFADYLKVHFKLDDTIWNFEKINFFALSDEIKNLAFLCSDKSFVCKYVDRGEHSRLFFNFENGLFDKLEIETTWRDSRIINYSKQDFGNFSMELAFGLTPFYYTEKFIGSYVNFTETKDHGTHLIGLVNGIKRGLKAYMKKQSPNKKVLVKSSSIKKYLFAAIHIKIDNPTLWGATKSRLQNFEVIKPISKYVSKITLEELEKDPKLSEDIIRHFE
jgi:DNA gyrase subunit B